MIVSDINLPQANLPIKRNSGAEKDNNFNPTLQVGIKALPGYFTKQFPNTPIYLAPHDNCMSPLPSRDCVAIRHPGQVPQSGTRAGIQKESDYIELSLDSGSRPP